MTTKQQKSSVADKQCSICGKIVPMAEFSYRNRDNRSYCVICDREEMAARRRGGNEAARKFRESKRALWKKA